LLNIICSSLTEINRDTIKMVFQHAEMGANDIRIIDIAHEDFDYSSADLLFVLGTSTVRTVVRSLVKAGRLSASSFTGNDLYDPDSGFMLVNVALEPSDIVISQENKDFMWGKVKGAATTYKKIVPFNDPIDDILPSEPVAAVAAVETPVEPVASVGEMVIPMIVTEPVVVETPAVMVDGNNDSMTFSTSEMLDKLFEQVAINDPSLSKTLSKYAKMTLHTSSGDLDVYPTSRIPADGEEGFFMALKDLVILLKFSSITSSDQITLHKQKNASVNT